MPSVQMILKELENRKSNRSSLDAHLQDIANYIIPDYREITTSPGLQMTGEKRRSYIFRNSAEKALDVLTGALHGLMSNPSTKFFGIFFADPEINNRSDVRRWTQDTSDRMHNVINNSNFHDEVNPYYKLQGAFGTGVMYVEEHPERVIHHQTMHIQECWIAENRFGLVDDIIREFNWTLRMVVQTFGVEVLSDSQKRKFEKEPDCKVKIVHAVYPRRDGEDSSVPGVFKYISKYIMNEGGNKKGILLREEGMRDFRFLTARWSKIPGEMYGRGPGAVALADTKMLQEVFKTTLKSAQKMVDPPLQMEDDAFLHALNLAPGAVNFRAAGMEKVEPIMTHGRVDLGYKMVEDIEKSIREAFYIDQLQLSEGPQMTATEVLQRTEEKMRLLGPMLSRQHSEFLRRYVDILFGIMWRRGMIMDPPDAIKGKEFDVQYSSMIAKAQRIQEAQNIARGMQQASMFISIDPSVVHNFDLDDLAVKQARLVGLPESGINSKEKKEAIRRGIEERRQQEREEINSERQVNAVAKIGPTVAKLAEQRQNQEQQ